MGDGLMSPYGWVWHGPSRRNGGPSAATVSWAKAQSSGLNCTVAGPALSPTPGGTMTSVTTGTLPGPSTPTAKARCSASSVRATSWLMTAPARAVSIASVAVTE